MVQVRLWVTARVITAAVGGYLLAMASCLLSAAALGVEGREAMLFNNLSFYLFYLFYIILVFSISQHGKANAVIWLANAVLWGLVWALPAVAGVAQ